MKFLAAILALAVGLASAAPAPSDVQLAERAAAATTCPAKGNVMMCSGSAWATCGTGPTSVPLDGSCFPLPAFVNTKLGSFGPDPNISCYVYADTSCKVMVLEASNPGSSNLYAFKDMSNSDPTGKGQMGHAARAIKCFNCPGCK